MKPADAPLNNRASLFKQTEPPLVRISEVSNRISHAIPVTLFASAVPVGSILRQASQLDIQAANSSKKRK